MWPFKKHKTKSSTKWVSPNCPNCNSTQTGIISFQDSNQTDYVRVWRGQRFVTCRCFACGKDFYVPEPITGVSTDSIVTDDGIDFEELRLAEEELKRKTEEDDDRRCL